MEPAWKRWCVVILMIVAMAGGYMLLYALSPLQTALEQKGWSLMAYSRYSSAESFLNVFCGILLFAGLLIDRLGVKFSGILAACCMIIGGAINYYALTDSFAQSAFYIWLDNNLNLPDSAWNITPFCRGMAPSAKLAAVGFMIFGVGIEMSGVAASRASVGWFKGKELAVAMGVQLAGSRLVVALALWASPRIAAYGGNMNVDRPLGWMLLILVVGLLCWLVYGLMDASKPSAQKDRQTAFITPLKGLLRNTVNNRILWLLAAICVAYYASLIPFYRYATAMLQEALNTSADSAAGVLASLPMISALCTPLVCLIPDFRGGAVWLTALGSLFMALCYLIFACILPLAPYLWLAYAAIGMLAIASAVISAGLWPLLPRVVPMQSLGSAYASFYWLQSLGLFLTPLAVAQVMGESTDYAPAMMLFSMLDVAALAGAVFLLLYNKSRKLGLNSPNRIKSGATKTPFNKKC